MNNRDLINLAIEAKKNAISPTGYKCGAALLSETGKVYTGCNLGSKDGLFDICAERLAICKMFSDGEKSFSKIAVVGGLDNELVYTTPCGICRQLIAEFGTDIEIIIGYEENGEIKEKVFTLNELLPESFNL